MTTVRYSGALIFCDELLHRVRLARTHSAEISTLSCNH
jgi:hypothetical protein